MGFLYYGLFYYLAHPLSLLVLALAILHFIRRRPDTYWLWVILLLGPIGAVVYLCRGGDAGCRGCCAGR